MSDHVSRERCPVEVPVWNFIYLEKVRVREKTQGSKVLRKERWEKGKSVRDDNDRGALKKSRKETSELEWVSKAVVTLVPWAVPVRHWSEPLMNSYLQTTGWTLWIHQCLKHVSTTNFRSTSGTPFKVLISILESTLGRRFMFSFTSYYSLRVYSFVRFFLFNSSPSI